MYEQLINSFQHVYGSSLASYEIGAVPADYLFRANEYFESVCWKNSGSPDFFLDTKKDLANNKIGRNIGLLAHQRILSGEKVDEFLLKEILDALQNKKVYPHFRDARVAALPSLEEYGCPYLLEIQLVRHQFSEWMNSLYCKKG